MAHNIGKMFYYGDLPWHELGTALAQPANLQEALSAGELDWRVEAEPLTLQDDPTQRIDQRVALVRTDRAPGTANRVVGVVHPHFVPLQNREGLELFDSLLGRGERVYHTGGYLNQGEVIWLMARVPQEITLNGQDVVEPYLLFTNSHDGSVGIHIRLTTVRVVCQNTLNMALHETSVGGIFSRAHHLTYPRLRDQAQAFFRFVSQQVDETQALFTRLAQRPCEDEAFQGFLNNLLPEPARPVNDIASVQRGWQTRCENLKKQRAEITRVWGHGIPERNIPADGQHWWGALNAVTAWVDHLQDTRSDRFAHNLFGAGNTLKTRALEQVKAMTTDTEARAE